MKKLNLVLLILSIWTNVNAQTYLSHNVTLLAHLDPETDSSNYGEKYSGCWGWYQTSKNREYAIIGGASHTFFIDVTNPTNPIVVDSVTATHKKATWREVKTYQNYCYIGVTQKVQY